MTPEQRIKRQIILAAIKDDDNLNWEGEITAENVEEVWESVMVGNDMDSEWLSYFRCSGEDSGIHSDNYSRHYECNEVATELDDGTWVGWTYWYGGGKYGEPDAIDWIEHAYDVDVVQETRVVNVFTKRVV